MNYADRDPWKAEAEAIEFDERDLDAAYAAELPSELTQHEIAADADEGFDDEFDEWLQMLRGRRSSGSACCACNYTFVTLRRGDPKCTQQARMMGYEKNL